MSKSLLFCGGPMPLREIMVQYVQNFDLVIAVDSGYRHAVAMDIIPHLLMGDFDSLDPLDLEDARQRGVEILSFPPIKDMTDTHLAIAYVLDKGYKEIRLVGALGSRMDHTLSNMSLLKWIHQKGAQGDMIDAYNEIYYFDSQMIFNNRQGSLLSILPITDLKGLNIKGVAYPLVDKTVPFSSSLCVSNIMIESKVEVSLQEGDAYIMITKDA